MKVKGLFYVWMFCMIALLSVVKTGEAGVSYFTDDFESGLDNWTVSGSDWAIATSTARGGSYSVTDSPSGNYSNNTEAAMTLAGSLDLSTATSPMITFWHKYALNYTDEFWQDYYDYAYLDYSTDGGFTWSNVQKWGTGTLATWQQVQIDLSDAKYKVSDLKIRFRIKSDSSYTADGWYIDDVEIREKDTSNTISLPFTDNFESGLGNWVVSGWDWDIATSTSRGGSYSVTDSPSGNYSNNTNAAMTLAGSLDLSTATSPMITFWHKYALNYTDEFWQDYYDYAYLDYSTDGGFTWSNIQTWGTGTLATWQQVQIDLSDAKYKVSDLKIRFRMASDSSYQADGWYIDDVEIKEKGGTSDTTPPTVSSTSPVSGATGVAVNATITATFSEAMDSTTINTSTFSLSGGVTGSVSYNSTTRTATFTQSSNLSNSTTYTATITTGVTDKAGNAMSSDYTWSFTTAALETDSTAPTGSISINSGATYTNSTTVTLSLSATDDTGVTGYYLSTSSTIPTASESGWTDITSTASYSESISYTLSSGDGDKTVYVWYKDAAGNVSASASDTITLDTTAPTITITSPTSSSTYTTTNSTISLSGSASDGTSGVSNVKWSSDKGSSGTASGTTSWSISSISLSSGDNVITLTATDGVGNTNTDSITVTYSASVVTPTPSPTLTPTPTPTDGLVAYYPFNGNADDESGNGNDGTVNGATLTTDRFGNTDSAYNFVGSEGDTITTSMVPPNTFSLSLWYKASSTQLENAGIVSTYRTTSYKGFYYPHGGSWEAIYVDNNIKHDMPNSDVDVDVWTHLTIVSDGSLVQVYKNGNLILSFSGTTTHAHTFVIGSSRFNGKFFTGNVDDIRIYNRALSESEILELYNEGGTPTPTPSPTPESSPTVTPSPTSSPTPAPIPTTSPSKPGMVYGTVNDTYEDALEGVNVTIEGEGISEGTETDEDGYYEFRELAPGDYTLTYEFEGYVTQTKLISLDEGEEKDLGTVTMPLMSTIYGYVVNVKEEPINKARLRFKGIGTKFTETKYSDADGYFDFTELESDTYLIFARKRGYLPKKVRVKLREGEEKDVGEITLRRKN